MRYKKELMRAPGDGTRFAASPFAPGADGRCPSRRSVLRGLAATAALAGAGVLAGCGAGAGSETGSAPASAPGSKLAAIKARKLMRHVIQKIIM